MDDEKKRPTLDELEAILNGPDDRDVKINQDGTITVTPKAPTASQVEAAARALYACEMARADNAQTVMETAAGKQLPGARERESYEEHADTTWRPDARAALTAALAVTQNPAQQRPNE